MAQHTHLFHILTFGHVFIAHFHTRVEQPLDEVSRADPHEVGSLVSTWKTAQSMRKKEKMIKKL